jgi:hypothetical protein
MQRVAAELGRKRMAARPAIADIGRRTQCGVPLSRSPGVLGLHTHRTVALDIDLRPRFLRFTLSPAQRPDLKQV